MRFFTFQCLLIGAISIGAVAATASTIDGITYVDGSYPGHSYDLHAFADFTQNPINPFGGPSQTLSGSGIVGLINSAFYSGGTLTYTFNGFAFAGDTLNGDGTINQLFFTGGSFDFEANASTWLTANAHPVDGSGDTLIVTFSYPGTGGISASTIGAADVTGGPAASYFDTNTQITGSDLLFISVVATSTDAPPGYVELTNGSSDLYADVVFPASEPEAAYLFGGGVAAVGLVRRRKRP